MLCKALVTAIFNVGGSIFCGFQTAVANKLNPLLTIGELQHKICCSHSDRGHGQTLRMKVKRAGHGCCSAERWSAEWFQEKFSTLPTTEPPSLSTLDDIVLKINAGGSLCPGEFAYSSFEGDSYPDMTVTVVIVDMLRNLCSDVFTLWSL